jgi:hypothetical protein
MPAYPTFPPDTRADEGHRLAFGPAAPITDALESKAEDCPPRGAGTGVVCLDHVLPSSSVTSHPILRSRGRGGCPKSGDQGQDFNICPDTATLASLGIARHGQIGNGSYPPRAAIHSPSRPSIALDPIGRSVELVLSTLLGHSASHSERLFLPHFGHCLAPAQMAQGGAALDWHGGSHSPTAVERGRGICWGRHWRA